MRTILIRPVTLESVDASAADGAVIIAGEGVKCDEHYRDDGPGFVGCSLVPHGDTRWHLSIGTESAIYWRAVTDDNPTLPGDGSIVAYTERADQVPLCASGHCDSTCPIHAPEFNEVRS